MKFNAAYAPLFLGYNNSVLTIVSGELTSALTTAQINQKPDYEGDYLYDELEPDIHMHMVGQDGFEYHTGWVGKGDDKLTKHLSQNESLPTSEVPSFDGFNCSKWIDMINKAWTGILSIAYRISGKIIYSYIK